MIGQALAQGLVGAWARLRNRLTRAAELDAIGSIEIDRIARDLGLTRDALRGLAAQGPDATNQLQCRLAAGGLSRTDFRDSDAAVLRDLERCCAVCSEKARCRRDLARSAHEARWPDYCLNAATLVSWQAAPHRMGNGQ